MANVMISWRNRVDSASLSGGAWEASFPLDNLRDERIRTVARSDDAQAASTILEADFGADLVVRVLGLVNHNLSLDAQVKVQLRDAASGGGALVGGMDTAVSVWPAGLAAEDVEGVPLNYVYVFAADYRARYLRVEISDAANPDGFVSLGRCWAGPVFQPARNLSYGLTMGWTHECPQDRSLGGVKYFGAGYHYRSWRLKLDRLSETEGQTALDMDRALGVSGQRLLIQDPDLSGLRLMRHSGLVDAKQLSPLEYPGYGQWSKAYDLEEVI